MGGRERLAVYVRVVVTRPAGGRPPPGGVLVAQRRARTLPVTPKGTAPQVIRDMAARLMADN